MDRFEEMRVFVSVAESGGFTQAARKLGVSRPAVSKYIMQLEERVGARLLHRTTRKVSVTETGKQFYDRALKLLSELHDLEGFAGQKPKVPSGHMRVLAPVNFALTRLGTAVSEFILRYPQLKLSLTLSDRPADPVDSGYDLAVRVGDPDSFAHAGLRVCLITKSKRILCASPGYLAKSGVPQKPKDLTNHQCLSYSYIDQPNLWQMSGKGRVHSIRVSGPIVTSSGQVLGSAAALGLGIAYGPTAFFHQHLQDGSVVRVLSDYELPQVSIYTVFPAGKHTSTNVTAFNDFIVDYFRRPDA